MLRLALLGALAVGTVPAAMFLLQERLIFFPQPLPGRSPAARPGVEEVEIVADGGVRIRGWLRLPPRRPAPLVLYFGGNAEEVSWLVETAPPLGAWALLLVNYRGYGRSEGRPGERALFADALLLHDWARGRPEVDRSRIAAMGRSLGTGVAVHLAAERALAGVVLVSPFDSLTSVAQRHYPWLPVRWLLRHPFDSLARAPSIQTPLLCLTAGRDTIVPPAHSARLCAAWAGPKRSIEFPNADHDGISGEPGYWPAIAAFLAELP